MHIAHVRVPTYTRMHAAMIIIIMFKFINPTKGAEITFHGQKIQIGFLFVCVSYECTDRTDLLLFFIIMFELNSLEN